MRIAQTKNPVLAALEEAAHWQVGGHSMEGTRLGSNEELPPPKQASLGLVSVAPPAPKISSSHYLA